jgi:hypothetical protein
MALPKQCDVIPSGDLVQSDWLLAPINVVISNLQLKR